MTSSMDAQLDEFGDDESRSGRARNWGRREVLMNEPESLQMSRQEKPNILPLDKVRHSKMDEYLRPFVHEKTQSHLFMMQTLRYGTLAGASHPIRDSIHGLDCSSI